MYHTVVSAAALTAAGGPYYYRIPLLLDAVTGMQIVWADGTSAFTGTFYSTCREDAPIPAATTAAPNLQYWSSEATDLPITTVTAAAAGSKVYHIGNCGGGFGLLRITPTANTALSIFIYGEV